MENRKTVPANHALFVERWQLEEKSKSRASGYLGEILGCAASIGAKLILFDKTNPKFLATVEKYRLPGDIENDEYKRMRIDSFTRRDANVAKLEASGQMPPQIPTEELLAQADADNAAQKARSKCGEPALTEDVQPQKMTLGKLAHGVAGLAKSYIGIDKAPDEIVEQRRSICSACPHAKKDDAGTVRGCGLCGCTARKLLLASEECPIKKWVKVGALNN